MKCFSKGLLSLFIFLFVVCGPAKAAEVLIPSPPQLGASAYLLMDATTGEIIVEQNADQQLPPASLTKMMTSYIVSNEIVRGTASMDDEVTISEKAWRKGGSKMFVEVGKKVPVRDLLRGVIIQSGNDASIALAEYIAGSEDSFADLMNQQASRLGMTNTLFKNATGWPDPEGEHLTTTRDLATLSRALINDFPKHYAIYAEKYFTFNNIKQPNRNQLLWSDESVDGIKTGHTEEAGFCLVASAKKNDMRLISVVMGTPSERARALESQKLLTYGFRYYQTRQLYQAMEKVDQRKIWGGSVDQLNIGPASNIIATLPRGTENKLSVEVSTDSIIKAPITRGQKIGTLTVSLDEKLVIKQPLVALSDIPQGALHKRLLDEIKLFFIKNSP
jgi:D-alanyl-D-alanine carboxypeptidase (penicillin-binding protein 5/6)